MLVFLGLLVLLFSGLGVWQLQRLTWKRDLIATVDERVNTSPIRVPVPAAWPGLDVAELVYQPVQLLGEFDHAREVQSLAVSELGGGYWVMTPLLLEGGGTVLVNRGFVPQSLRDPAIRTETPPSGRVAVVGLLRASEPEGGFLRDNDPGAGRWYSRDTPAIAQAQGLPDPVAPFFVDAFTTDLAEKLDSGDVDGALRSNLSSGSSSGINGGAAGGVVAHSEAASQRTAAAMSEDFPLAGLTVVRFRNTHLSYALTWFALAVLSAVGMALLLKEWGKGRSCGRGRQ